MGAVLTALVLGSARAATIQEDFATDPAARGWEVHGEAALFRWAPGPQNLEVTWDSRQTNSFFSRPLGTVLATNDDFSLAFDLQLREVVVGIDPTQPFTFPLAIGLINWRGATLENFRRGVGVNPTYGPRNLVEFDYFPDSGFGATIAPTIVSTNNRFAYAHSFPLELTPGDLFHIELAYTASNRVLRTRLTRNGAPFGLPPDNLIEDVVMANTPDFRIDTLAVSSYSDDRADGSILARGTVDNLVVTLPPPPVRNLAGTVTKGHFEARFEGEAPWLYALERNVDGRSWTTVASGPAVTGTGLVLQDPEPLRDGMAWYRVRAERP